MFRQTRELVAVVLGAWLVLVTAVNAAPVWTIVSPSEGSSFPKTADIACNGMCYDGEDVDYAISFIRGSDGNAIQTMNDEAGEFSWGLTLERPVDEEMNPINWPVAHWQAFKPNKIKLVPTSGSMTPTSGEVRITITES